MPKASLAVRILGRAALLAAGLLVAILILEVAARLAWKDVWLDPSRDAPTEEGLEPVNGILRMASRNVRGINRGVFYRTNEYGVRSRSHSVTPAEGVFRILVTGDSVAMGSGVLEELRFTNLLDGRHRGTAGPEYEFVNIALSGLNIHHAMNRLERLLPHYESDLFVYGFTINDIVGPHFRSANALTSAPGDLPDDSSSDRASAGTPRRAPAESRSAALWTFVQQAESSPSYLVRYLRMIQLSLSYDLGAVADEYLYNYFENEEARADFLGGLDRFARIAEDHGVCGIVMILAQLEKLDEDHPLKEIYEFVAEESIERGLSVVRTLPYLEGQDERGLWVSLLDSHPNRVGHAILARSLEDGLEALPEECFERPRVREVGTDPSISP